MIDLQVFLLTTVTMIAFAANSVLARLALADGSIDPGSYSLIRLLSGAVMLVSLLAFQHRGAVSAVSKNGSWWSAFCLFAYAAAFSFAYLSLDTGTGALILFACVQATMIGWSLWQGDRPVILEWFGLILAFGAFVYLVSPGLSAPDSIGAGLMIASGIAWGAYSLRGKLVKDALLDTAGNFVRATPMALILMLAVLGSLSISTFGAAMALLSGMVTSGLGYALWYRVLRHLTGTQAAIIQLSVPAIAAFGGVVLVAEPLSLRMLIACPLILCGIGLAIWGKSRRL